MNKTPLISVIVPVYKVELYLIKCIESLLIQTYTNIEIVLVDDGSPDRCGYICDEYANKDNRITVIHKNNGGLSDARNSGLQIIKGEYVTFIDSDDFIMPNHIDVLYDLILKYHVDLSISNFVHYYAAKGKEIPTHSSLEEGALTSLQAIETMFYQDKFETSAWGKLYKTQLFGNDIEYPKGLLYEDLPTTYRLILKAGKIAYTKQQTYYYVLRKDSIQYSTFNSKKLDIIKIADIMEEDIANNYPALLISLKCRLFCSYLNVFLQISDKNTSDHVLWERIISSRRFILFNIKARKKAIIAAVLSFGGKSLLRSCYHFINLRK